MLDELLDKQLAMQEQQQIEEQKLQQMKNKQAELELELAQIVE